MKDLDRDIYGFIRARLTDTISVEEEGLLEAWLEESADHREEYRDYCRMWYTGKWAGRRESVCRDTGWKLVIRKRRIRRRRRIVIWSGSVAASLLLVSGLIGVLHMKHEPMSVVQCPEGNRKEVTLVLSTGERMELKDFPTEMRGEEGVVIYTDSASLVYQNRTEEKKRGEIVYNELIVPKGGEYRLLLADGSLVVMNSESRLRFPVQFCGEKREVFLSGEAWFEVAKDSVRPFVVCTEQLAVGVLGTMFNVSAYADEECTEVTLVNGRVKVTGGGNSDVLKPGQQLLFHNRLAVREIREVDTGCYTAWKDGLFRYDAIPLRLLMLKLSRWFDIRYEFVDDSLGNVLYSGGFWKYESLQEVLDMIGEVTSVSFTVEDHIIKVGKK